MNGGSLATKSIWVDLGELHENIGGIMKYYGGASFEGSFEIILQTTSKLFLAPSH
jgi:hypothetical protein